MRFLDQPANLVYVMVRFLWRRLPLRWRDRVRRFCHGRDPLRAAIDLPFAVSHLLWRHVPYTWRRRISRAWHYVPAEALRQPIHDELRRRLKEGPGPSVLMLPLLSWYECGFQRPHQMARALAAAGCPVVFYEPWKVGPRGQGGLALSSEADQQRQFVGLREISEQLYLLRVPHWFLAECLVETPPDCLVMLWPYQARFIPRESPSMVMYEMVDDHDLLPGIWWWRHIHERWLRDADIVATTAESLLKKIDRSRFDALLLPNAVRVEDWRVGSEQAVPPDLERAREAPIVVVYYGAIGQWFDWDLWLAVVAAKPNWSFVLIGFPFGLDEQELTERVSRHNNLYYLGPKAYTDLPRYMAHADVATIPFKLNDITHSCSPLKLFEYMAAGKPIVATPMHEILKYKSVLLAEGARDFVRRLDEAVQNASDPQYLDTLKAEARANTWQSRAKALRIALEAVRERQNGVARRRLTKNRKVKAKS